MPRATPSVSGGGSCLGRGTGEQPKYVNTPETNLYSKRRLLYGLNWAKDSVVRSGTVVVCEGYTDVIGFHQAGVTQAVATCGTALADEHFALMRGFARRAVLAFDADSAGQAAAERVYEWERRHELDVAVARLPPGQDPGDLWRTEPEVLSQAIAEARPYLRFRLERVMATGELGNAEGRARVANAALEVVAEHPDELVRDQYLMELATICRIEPDRLRTRLVALMKGERHAPSEPGRRLERGPERTAVQPPAPARVNGTATARQDRVAVAALRLAVQSPDQVAGRLASGLFKPGIYRQAYAALEGSPTLEQAIDAAPEEVAMLLRRLAVEDGEVDLQAVTTLLREAGNAALKELLAQAMVADPVRAAEIGALTEWLWRAMDDLRERPADPSAGTDLVSWLLEHSEEEA